MKMAHSMQGIYSPLPQSLSDSDSEKEISMEPICTSYHSKGDELPYRGNGHSLNEDLVAIKSIGASKMSFSRKVAFVTSIILCFLPIVIFLWVLPCSELHTCQVKIANWERQIDGVELKGRLNLVKGLYDTNTNLAIMYKGSFKSDKRLYGFISFIGLTGNVAWNFQQDVEPLAVDCDTIDTNLDGRKECLLVDSKGLKAIETVSGQALWHAHSSEKQNLVRNLALPISIRDLDGDNVKELLSIYENQKMLIISGKTGRALANIKVPHCNNLTKISSVDTFIKLTCENSTRFPQIYRINLIELEKTYNNSQYHMIMESTTDEIDPEQYHAGGRTLTVRNGANCPKCTSNITLLDSNQQIMKIWNYNNTYIMHPKPVSFTASKKLKLQGHLTGFVVKIWQWSQHYRKLRPNQRINRRSLNDTVFTTEVSERVVLITFNDSNIHEINASYTEITQICHNHDGDCQPRTENQLDSIMVEDLENDSSRELVSFYSSYIKTGDDWRLVSFLKLLRLEEELPKLYGSK